MICTHILAVLEASKVSVALGLGIVFVCLFRFSILFFFSGLSWTSIRVLFVCCVRFSFLNTRPRD